MKYNEIVIQLPKKRIRKMGTKKITIHKANELVRGGDKYSIFSKRLLNTLYLALQKANAFNVDYITIPFASIRSYMGLEKEQNYVAIMKQSFEELQQPLQLNNFKDPRTGEEWHWFSCSFIDEVGFKKDESGRWVAKIRVNSLIKYLMSRQENFTKLELIPYLNKMRTKYSMKLYEYLKSFSGFRYIDIPQKYLMQLFGINDNDKSYKNYANLKQLLKRQIEEIRKKTDLKEIKLQEAKVLAKEKKFRIIINPKAKRKVDDITAKQGIKQITQNLFKRF